MIGQFSYGLIRRRLAGCGVARRVAAARVWYGVERPGESWWGQVRFGMAGKTIEPRRARKDHKMIATKEKQIKKSASKKDLPRQDVTCYKLNLKTIYLKLKGTTPLIVHKFSSKSLRMIEEKQQGKGKAKEKANRKPEEEFNQARYIVDKKKKIDGFPASGFKKAAVRAGTYMDMKMVFLRGAFHVIGDMIPIICKKGAIMRTDTVRIGMGVCDVRYRPEYQNWSCQIPVQYNANVISAEQIVNIFNVAGFAVGLGDWRPEKDGQFGMFEVEIG